MGTTYENDIVAWANEQAALLRAGKFTAIDIEHIAEEIEDVGKSEQRELENRMAVLLAHLLKWQFQPERQCSSWAATINDQRKRIARRVQKTPSLKSSLTDQEWWDDAWTEARVIAERETGLNDFPEARPWSIDDVIADGWLPS